MKTKTAKKVVLMCSVVLIGIAVCILVWFFLRQHKAQVLQGNSTPIAHNNKGVAKSRNTLQPSQNPDGNRGEALLSFEESVARGAKSNFMSLYSEDELATPDMQKFLKAMDSPEAIEWMKDMMENGPNYRKFWDVLESQGIPVDREVFAKLFHKVFPTGEPEDYEPEMRLELAKLFLAAEPVDPADSRAVLRQGLAVYAKFIKEGDKTFPWLAGRFDIDWDGAILGNTENNPAFEWVKDVQRNAANIVAGAEAAGDPGPDTDSLASSWDLSSVMESPPASHSETEVPTTPDTSGSVLMTDAEIEAAIEKSLTRQTPDILTNQQPDTPIEIQSNLETTLKSQFSSERFERAMSTLEQYGPEEGLRRLRENDPEVASQIEQHRNRFRSGDSDKSEEVSK